MATPKTITAFKYRTEVIADITKHTSEFKKAEATVDKYGKTVQKIGKDTAKAFDGQAVGKKWGSDFGSSAVSAITGSIGSIGQTIGALIGTGIAPGIGTAIGSTIGSGIDAALQKVSGPILEQITRGIELNKLLERSKVHFTTFVGDEKEAIAHLEDLKKLSGDTGLRMGVLVEGSQRLEEFTSKLDLTRLFMRAAADQSAKFYGDATKGFDSMADSLGRIMLRGEDVGKLMKQLEGQGVHWKQYLAEGLGLSEKQVAALVKAGRIRGEGIATLTAQGIERHAGGFAQMMGTVGPGIEQRAGALMEIRAAEGTQRITGGIGDAYAKFAQLLASPEAKKVVDFIDKMGGYVVDLTESAVKKAVSIGGGIAEGIMDFSPSQMMGGLAKLGDFVDTGLKAVFEINTPSKRAARVAGEPIGEGIATGILPGFEGAIGPVVDEVMQSLRRRFLSGADKAKTNLEKLTEREPGFMPKLVAGAQSRGMNPDYILNTMAVETAGSFNPAIKNPISSASGLIQFMDSTARSLGTTTAAIRTMSATQQLDLVFRYFDQYIKKYGPLDTQGKVYAAVGAGRVGATDESVVMRRGQPGYEGNKATWDRNLDGLITQGEMAVAAFNKLGAGISFTVNGGPVTTTNPVPVYDIEGGGAMLNRQAGPRAWATRYAGIGTPIEPQKDPASLTGGDPSKWPQAIVDVTEANRELISTTSLTAAQIGAMGITLHKLVPPIADVTESARAAYATNADVQRLNRQLYIENASLGQQIVGAFQQISGMIPGQQVGKKRGFFSKLLGFAAPFLPFIPGIGPILSTIAGAASNAIGGNYGAAVSGIAGGFATGGVFHSSGTGTAPPKTGSSGHARALGGPGYRGQLYWTGERGPEPFIAPANGRFLSHRDAMSAMGGSGAGSPDFAGAVDRLHALLSRLESMPAHEVVRLGAKGIFKAMDSNASISEGMGRRMRLA